MTEVIILFAAIGLMVGIVYLLTRPLKRKHEELEKQLPGKYWDKNIPTKLIYALKDEYGDKVKITDDDDALVNILETPWYKDLKEKTTPGDTMRIYREKKGK